MLKTVPFHTDILEVTRYLAVRL